MEIPKHKTSRAKTVTAILLAGSILSACEQQASATEASTDMIEIVQAPSHTIPVHQTTSDRLEKAWSEALHDYPGQIDIAVYDYSSGDTAHYTNKPEKQFVAASTIKLSILEKLLIDNQSKGISITDEQLGNAAPMITKSDNQTASILWNELGGAPSMQEFYRLLGTTSTIANTYGSWGVSLTTALDQLEVVKQIASPGPLLSENSATIAHKLLDEVIPEQRWGVPAGIPAEITTRVKNGWLDDKSAGNDFAENDSWTNNSIGYVEGEMFGKKIKYAMAEYSSGNPDKESGDKLLSYLASAAWNIIVATSE